MGFHHGTEPPVRVKLRETIERPSAVVDVTGLSCAITDREDGSILIGAAAKNTVVAEHQSIRTRYPLLARAILAGASGQIRNMATVAGNILQRTLYTYFYDVPPIDLIGTDIPDPHAPMGAHGVGDIGITGVGAAVANAVYNATAKVCETCRSPSIKRSKNRNGLTNYCAVAVNLATRDMHQNMPQRA